MPTLTILTDYDGDIEYNTDTAEYTKDDTDITLRFGWEKPSRWRSYKRFPLTDLPIDATVQKVELKVFKQSGTSDAGVHDIHAYGTNGQEDPELDSGSTLWNRCGSGNLYVNDTTIFRTTPAGQWITIDLGSQAVMDVQNAKSAVNRFAVAIHEEGDNDIVHDIRSSEYDAGDPTLIITYTVPTAGYSYSDGLVCVQVSG